ncbi:MAG: efflux RND transporter periplasmic adaptor subunit [Acidobacteria bacterium]|nr:efflux RND transporter periplasmic adaptor subunit [Acidobacteriota bacterium]
MKKLTITLIVLVVIAGSVGAYYKYGRPEEVTKFTYLAVTRGDVVESVGATGTLQAVRTVMVGSQVSGQIKSLRNVDFNSIVLQGQVVAELDPSLFQTQVEQAQANVTRSQTDRDRLKITVEDSRNKLTRTQSLFDRKIATQQDLETAQVNVRSAEASLKSSESSIVQAQASLNQAQVSLEHTIITAPITGIVISRNVDVGQTVAASMNAPTIFIIAGDLTQMQVLANVDESDVGRIRPNQVVRFKVDAFPTEEFYGSVSQVRLNPIVSQNVVTYATVIDVPNPLLKLKLGMTANVTIEIAKKTDVLRIPNAAYRYRPTKDVFDALKLPFPAELAPRAAGARGGPGGGSGGGTRGQANGARGEADQNAVAVPGAAPAGGAPRPSAATPASTPAPARPAEAPSTSAAQTRGQRGNRQPGEAGSGGGRGGGRQSMQERMANMTPAEREAFIARMKERGIDPNNPSAGRGAGGGRGGGGMTGSQPGRAGAAQPARAGISAIAASKPGAQTIDQLFGALPPTMTRGRAWIYVGGQLKSVQLRLGISDGTWTELLGEELKEGQELVTNIVTPAMAAAAAARPSGQPNQNQQQGRGANPFQGGGGGGRGPGGGR